MIPTIAQLPVTSRYTEEWYGDLKAHKDFDVVSDILSSDLDRSKAYNWFTDLEYSVNYDVAQLVTVLNRNSLEALFITDLDFPGIIPNAIPVLKLKFPDLKIYGIFHAGTWCKGDIFEGNVEKQYQEYAIINMCDIIFVATQYHKKKIEYEFGESFDNIRVLGGLPFYVERMKHFQQTKSKDVLVVGRQEQINIKDIPDNWDHHVGLIPRYEYLHKLAQYKIVVIPKVEETFGYNVLEAIALGCIPIVPDTCSYPELVSDMFRYTTNAYMKVRHDVQLNLAWYYKHLRQIDLSKYTLIWDNIAKEINEHLSNI